MITLFHILLTVSAVMQFLQLKDSWRDSYIIEITFTKELHNWSLRSQVCVSFLHLHKCLYN